MCPTLCDPMDCSLPGSSIHGIFQARVPERVRHRIFPTQGSNPGLPHCRQMLCHLSHKGSPIITINEVKKVKVLVFRLHQTLCDPMNCSPPGSSVCGVPQARIPEWIAIFSPRDLPDPGIEPRSPSLRADSLPSEPQIGLLKL